MTNFIMWHILPWAWAAMEDNKVLSPPQDHLADADRLSTLLQRMDCKELGITVIYKHTVTHTPLIQEYKFTFHHELRFREKNSIVHEDEEMKPIKKKSGPTRLIKLIKCTVYKNYKQ